MVCIGADLSYPCDAPYETSGIKVKSNISTHTENPRVDTQLIRGIQYPLIMFLHCLMYQLLYNILIQYIIVCYIQIPNNGRYKSVVHRAGSEKSRISMATLMSMPFEAKVGPAPELIDEHHPALYRETKFVEFNESAGFLGVQSKGVPRFHNTATTHQLMSS